MALAGHILSPSRSLLWPGKSSDKRKEEGVGE